MPETVAPPEIVAPDKVVVPERVALVIVGDVTVLLARVPPVKLPERVAPPDRVAPLRVVCPESVLVVIVALVKAGDVSVATPVPVKVAPELIVRFDPDGIVILRLAASQVLMIFPEASL